MEFVTAIAAAPADAEKQKQLSAKERKETANGLRLAKGFIEKSGPRGWPPLADWLAQDADVDAVAAEIEIRAGSTRDELAERYPQWLKNKEEQGRLAVKIGAARYMHKVSNFEDCPVCEQEVPQEIREELERLASQAEADTDALKNYLREQIAALQDTLPKAMRKLATDAPKGQLASMFTERVGNHLKQFASLQQEASDQWKPVVDELPEWECVEPETGVAGEDWDPEFTRELADIEAQYAQAFAQCELCEWAQEHAETVAGEVERAAAAVTDRLAMLAGYADRYEKLDELRGCLDEAATTCEEADTQLDRVAEADRVHGVLTEFAALDKYAQLSLQDDLAKVDDTMRGFYDLLYHDDPIDFGGLTNRATGKSPKADFGFLLKLSEGLFADAEPISNAGRMRGILWAYTFARITAQRPSLQVIALHDPYTSLDDYAGQSMMMEVVVKRLGSSYQPLSTICEEHLLKPLWGRDPDQDSFAVLRVLRRGPNHRYCRVAPGVDPLREAVAAYGEDKDKWKPVVEKARVYLEDNLKLVAEFLLPTDHSSDTFGRLVRALAPVALEPENATALGRWMSGDLKALLAKKLNVDLDASPPTIPNSSPVLNHLHHGGSDSGLITPAHADDVEGRYGGWASAFKRLFDRIDFILSRADTVPLAQADALPAVTEDSLPVQPIQFSEPIAMVGRVAAEGRVTLQDVDAEKPVRYEWPELDFALVTEDVCAPVALPGQTAILASGDVEVKDRDLAVIGAEGAWRLRRVFRANLEGEEEQGWVGQTINPLVRDVGPVTVPAQGAVLRKLVGVLYSKEVVSDVPADAEIVPVPSSWPDVLGMLNGGKADLIEVTGDSADPVALEGQYLIVVKAEPDEVRDGRLCCVELSDGRTVLKRLTRSANDPTRLLLQPINPQAEYPIIEARLGSPPDDDESGEEHLPHVEDIRVVRGVLFDEPEALGEVR